MGRHIKLVIIILVVCFLYSCKVRTFVNPVRGETINSICIKNNSDIFVKEFANGLKELIESQGINAKIYSDIKPVDCEYHMEYIAEWKWDFAMYLYYANLIKSTNGKIVILSY